VIIVSYYTKNTGYEQEVKNLIVSCKKFGLKSDIVGIESKGRWDTNCCYKPRFLLEKLREHQSPVVWMDADALFLKQPTLFQTLTCDVALRTFDDLPMGHPSKIITGTLFFHYRISVFNLLEQWDIECRAMLRGEDEVWDQVALQRALLKTPSLRLFPLPEDYYLIYDTPAHRGKTGVIVHYQASRLLKKVVNGEVVRFWGTDMLSQEQRRLFSELM